MIHHKKKYIALGMMSGTSLDGLDMALCEFSLESETWKYKILKSETKKYPNTLLKRLSGSFTSTASEIFALDCDLGVFFGKVATDFLSESEFTPDLIASHGHTVFHEPTKGYTVQIGSAAQIADQTGILTINDFRSLDVSKGGNGAPLVPIGDELLFSEYDACINLGGFANISYKNAAGARIAFDICPVNFVLNRISKKLGMEYDDGGSTAKSGQLIPELLSQLNSNSFYQKEPPKSLGQEWVEKEVFPLLQDFNNLDVLATYTEHVSEQINKVLSRIQAEKILITGGGVYNHFLIELIQRKINKKLILPNTEIIEMKEALIFAFLGVRRLRGEVNCLASCTGASGDSVGGEISLP